jgi:uncharacterized protein (UPF0332 family)
MLEDARALLQQQCDEARSRTVISRAYYAAYHLMLTRPFAQRFSTSQGAGAGIHRQFLDFLKQTSDPKVLRARARLKGIYERRIRADYRPDLVATHNMAKEVIEDADELFEICLGEEAGEAGEGV